MNLNTLQIGAFLQSRRKMGGMTQTELAEKLGVSSQSVSNWERGETIPDVSMLPDLAVVLHCSVDAILSGGAGSGGFRRHITVVQMQEALSALDRIGASLRGLALTFVSLNASHRLEHVKVGAAAQYLKQGLLLIVYGHLLLGEHGQEGRHLKRLDVAGTVAIQSGPCLLSVRGLKGFVELHARYRNAATFITMIYLIGAPISEILWP